MVADHQGHRHQGGVMTMRVFAIAVAVVLLALSGAVQGQAHFPSKPITLVVGFAPGGPTDTTARVLAEKMKDTLGQSVIVENQAGAGGTIALVRVARADADGHTLYLGNWTVNVGSVTMYPFPYDVLNDFEPIALLTSAKTWVIARKDLPANTAKEFVDWLKANPGKANAASVGVGSAAHVCLLDLMRVSGATFQFINYRGRAPAVQALAAGEADFACLEGGQTLGLYHAGKVKPIGVASKTRWFAAPEVPTLAEGGVPGELEFWHGLWAPKHTPKPVIAKLAESVQRAFADPWVQQRFKDVGHTIPPPQDVTPERLYAHHKAEIEKWWPIIKAENIKLQ
jgi:tripartite-type tricarboxylate transporter receptor subunit TctC